MRLFWKILFIFWVIFYLSFQLTWIGFTFYSEQKARPLIDIMPTKIDMIAQLLHYSGEEDALGFVRSLPEKEREVISIKVLSPENHFDIDEKEPMDKPHAFYSRITDAPDGTEYEVDFIDKKSMQDELTIFHIPFPLFFTGICVGLFFSLFLAWNLTKPMNLLRQGFYRVSQGDLSVRLYQKLARRRDELSDLGKDFDIMVEKLNLLLSSRQILLHDVSHELRTPLARLQLAIGLAQQKKQNIENALSRIELESQRLDQLIGEILNYSRAEIDSYQMDDYFDLNDLLNLVINDANYEANPQSITVNYTKNSVAHPIVNGNAEQIRRAIENIIRNAIRFSKPGQKIEISLREISKYLHIEVKDNGPGVDKEKLNSIFDPFVRIQSPQLGKGYGLGLAIAKKALTLHNGSITANNHESGGLIVSIEIPYWNNGNTE